MRRERPRLVLSARIGAVVLAVVVSAACVTGGAAAEESSEELEALREAIAASRDRVGDFERSERDLLEVLEGIDREATRLRVEARSARRKAAAARAVLEDIRPKLEAASAKLSLPRWAMP